MCATMIKFLEQVWLFIIITSINIKLAKRCKLAIKMEKRPRAPLATFFT